MHKQIDLKHSNTNQFHWKSHLFAVKYNFHKDDQLNLKKYKIYIFFDTESGVLAFRQTISPHAHETPMKKNNKNRMHTISYVNLKSAPIANTGNIHKKNHKLNFLTLGNIKSS